MREHKVALLPDELREPDIAVFARAHVLDAPMCSKRSRARPVIFARRFEDCRAVAEGTRLDARSTCCTKIRRHEIGGAMHSRRPLCHGLALAFVGLLAACSSGTSAGLPSNSVAPSAPPLTANLIGPLQFVGQTAVLQVSQQGYLGPFTITSSNGAVLSVAPKLQASQRGPAATGTQTIISANGQAYVSALAQGSASISVNGYGGITVAPAQLQNLAIGSPTPSPSPSPTASPTPTPGAVVLAPNALAFTAVGASNAQSTTASESNYSGTFTAATAAAGQPNSCSGIATISPASGTTFSVTPVAAGHCTFTVSGGGTQSATLTIDVTTTTVGGS